MRVFLTGTGFKPVPVKKTRTILIPFINRSANTVDCIIFDPRILKHVYNG